ncbi:DAPG hydrolase family protein [Clostridium botulinum]|uniref:Phloretin hydrolase n=1 Tax=Clostridium botulinum TaxID=1491 RepID=A0ABD7CG45_CLOBO|nr:hypothetical protein [Clostridium botulinum]KGO14629.1 hypothetical protein NZ45_06295 [Clostridium botulinum]KIN80163.1 hypothetical protein SD74_16590 [Clostridium botulinum]MCC5426372.1 phloretin hydrolase [Clostridium botulinum]QRI52078.1 phloretin hydrolase [Clostridium botulinum]
MSYIKELEDYEKNISYSKYYYMEMAKQPKDSLEKIMEGPIKSQEALTIENKDELLNIGYLDAEVGYCVMDNGTGFISNIIKMPKVTKEMFDWWFAWHGLEPLRYKIWNREDHFGIKTTKRERLLNKNIPMEERIWGVTHTVDEDTGFGSRTIHINFMSPEDMGFDIKLLKQSNVLSIVSGNGDDAVMCHSIRSVEHGIELRSRFWIGYNIVDKKPVKILPEGDKVPLEVAKRLLLHNVKEYSNLAKILPSVYEEEKYKE